MSFFALLIFPTRVDELGGQDSGGKGVRKPESAPSQKEKKPKQGRGSEGYKVGLNESRVQPSEFACVCRVSLLT